MLKPSTLHKRGRRKRKRKPRRKPTPTTGYFIGRRHYATLQDVWRVCGVGDARRPTKAEAIYGDVLARAAADANGCFYVNSRRVQIAVKLPINANVTKGLAQLDRIAAEIAI